MGVPLLPRTAQESAFPAIENRMPREDVRPYVTTEPGFVTACSHLELAMFDEAKSLPVKSQCRQVVSSISNIRVKWQRECSQLCGTGGAARQAVALLAGVIRWFTEKCFPSPLGASLQADESGAILHRQTA
jgi:hypothetical protein